MKVLAISSSPRIGGNSDVLCDQFLKGANEAGHDTEKIQIRNQQINPCLACYACLKKGICAIADDMEEIQQKMIKADVIVLSAPVYFYSMNAQMKIVIDRCITHYKEIQNKQFYFVVTAADPNRNGVDETIAGLRGFLRCLPEAREMGIIYGTGAWDKGDVFKHPAFEQAYEIGNKL